MPGDFRAPWVASCVIQNGCCMYATVAPTAPYVPSVSREPAYRQMHEHCSLQAAGRSSIALHVVRFSGWPRCCQSRAPRSRASMLGTCASLAGSPLWSYWSSSASLATCGMCISGHSGGGESPRPSRERHTCLTIRTSASPHLSALVRQGRWGRRWRPQQRSRSPPPTSRLRCACSPTHARGPGWPHGC